MTWALDHLDEIMSRAGQHAWLAGLPLVLGLVIAAAARLAREPHAVAAGRAADDDGLLYTIPSLALFILLPPLLGTKILDPVNVIVAMTIYTVALLTRTVADGLSSVDASTRQAAIAMGYGGVRPVPRRRPAARRAGHRRGAACRGGEQRQHRQRRLAHRHLAARLLPHRRLRPLVPDGGVGRHHRLPAPRARLRPRHPGRLAGADAVDPGGGRMTPPTIWAWFTDPANWQGTDGVPNRVVRAPASTPRMTLRHRARHRRAARRVGRATPAGCAGSSPAPTPLRAVPTLGLLFAVSMFVGPLIQSDLAFVIPSIAVLVLLAIPPLLSGTYAGIDSVEPAARDAARGMGMTGWQVLTKVEAPCALPLFLSGLRSATLQVIATATIAASVSLGGLGRYLIDGLASRDYVQMVCGSILVAVLALVADGVLALLEKWAVSPGISGRSTRVARSRARHADPALSNQTPPVQTARTRDPRQAALVGSGSTGPVEATAATGTPSERDRS